MHLSKDMCCQQMAELHHVFTLLCFNTSADEKAQTPSCQSPASESKAAAMFSSSSSTSSSSSLSSSSALCDSVTESEIPHSDFTNEEQSTSFNPPVALSGSSTSGSEEKTEKGEEDLFIDSVIQFRILFDDCIWLCSLHLCVKIM